MQFVLVCICNSMAKSENWSPEELAFNDVFHDLLPEDVVKHIISFLPTKEAIKTSRISKRWRFLWKTISNLDFNDYEHYRSSNQNCGSFTRYVNNVLLRLDSTNSIHKLSMSLELPPNTLPDFPNWVSSAVKHDIKDLNLKAFSINTVIRHRNRASIMRELVGCKSLELLSLSQFEFEFPKEGSVCFPNLEFLSLRGVRISGIPTQENSPACLPKLKRLCLSLVTYGAGEGDCVMNLIRNCPLLENLSIERKLGDHISNADLCIPQLTTAHLYFDLCSSVGLDVQIEAPIKYLKISDWNPRHKHNIVLKIPDALIKAELVCYTGKRDLNIPEQCEMLELLKTFDKVKCLSLVNWNSVINISNTNLPVFDNLIRLEVALDCENLWMVESFLNSAINLQILVVCRHGPRSCTGKYEWRAGEDGRRLELSNVLTCLISSLKRFEIAYSVHCECDIEMIRIMLNSAKVLEKLVAKPDRLNERKNIDSLCEEISAFPRASASCQFDV